MGRRSTKYLEDLMRLELARLHAAEQERQLREDEAEEKREALAQVLQIEDPKILDQLMDLDLCSSSVLAFSLLPLVAVAWADWEIQKKERDAVLKAAAEHGIEPGCLACTILEGWLTEKPDPEVFNAWKSYIGELAKSLDDAGKAELKSRTLDLAREVAGAAGGFLGIGSKISAEERAVLEDLEKVLS